MKKYVVAIIVASILAMFMPSATLTPVIASSSRWHYDINYGMYVDITGFNENDVFVISARHPYSSEIMHFDGINWTPMFTETNVMLNAIWSNSSSVFAVGRGGCVVNYDGLAWTVIREPTLPLNSFTEYDLSDVWGTSETDIFAVGRQGRILHYNGVTWAEMESGVIEDLRGIWGTSSNDVYVVGGINYNGIILHYDGNQWTTFAEVPPPTDTWSIWGTSSENIYIFDNIVMRYDGTVWETVDIGTAVGISQIWGTSETNLYAVGKNKTIVHFDGIRWMPVEIDNYGLVELDYNQNFIAIWGSSDTNIFVTGYHGTIIHFNGHYWYNQLASGGNDGYSGIWGVNENVFVTGNNFRSTQNHILLYNGSSWQTIDSGTTGSLRDTWGTAYNNVFAVGNNGVITHFDGTNWTSMESNTVATLLGVWASSVSSAFAVGINGVILKYNGIDWTPIASNTTASLTNIWGSSPSNIYAVGSNGTILRSNGASWAAMTSGTTDYLTGVWGTSSTDVFAISLEGNIYHCNGNVWSKIFSDYPATYDFRGIWGTSSNDVYVVGSDRANTDMSIIFHYDGLAWTPIQTNISGFFMGIGGNQNGDIYTIGDGSVIHYGQADITLNILTNGNGTTSPSPNIYTYSPNSEVSVTAIPSTGWIFSHWSGDASGTVNPINVTMNSNKTVIANFIQPKYILIISCTGQGSVTLPPGMSSPFLEDTVVSLKATPNNGWVFSHWSGDIIGNANPVSITMNNHKSVTANFVLEGVTLISLIKQNPTAYAGQTVKISGGYRGWESGYGSPPVTRSDWVLRDETGFIYVTGASVLMYPNDLGKSVQAIGIVRIKDGQPYIKIPRKARF